MPNQVLQTILSALTEDGFGLIFFLVFVAIIFLFILQLILIKVCPDAVKRTRVIFLSLYLLNFLVLVSISLIDTTFYTLDKTAICFVTFGVETACFSLLLVKKKPIKITENQKKLVNALDEKIEKVEQVSIEEKTDDVTGEEECGEINFSHVLSVLDRLKFYPLNQTEKKQMMELSFAVNKAKGGTVSFGLRNEINEKLSDLLKIMSKYNV